MSFEHLKLFKDIAREQSITRGAGINKVSQSAASQHLHELERTLEVPLLDRSTRPIRLTAAGRLYYDLCRDVLRRRDEFETALNRLKMQVEGRVRIASIYSIGISETARFEEDFRARFPDAQIAIEYLRPEKVYEAVLQDRADIGLVSYPESGRDIKVIPWRDEVMLVATPPGHPLAANVYLAPAQLDGEPFVGFDEDLPVSRHLRRFFKEHGIRMNLLMHFDNVIMIKEAVALGSGIAILPEPVLLGDIAAGRLVGIPLESPGLHRPVGIIHERRKQFNRAGRAFLEMLERRRH